MAGFLSGKRVLVTRAKQQAGSFIELLKKEEADPVVLPLLAFEKKETKENLDYLSRLHEYSWLFFTSANGVKFFFELIRKYGFNDRLNADIRIASVGKKTTEALLSEGAEPDFQPDDFNGRQMAAQFLSAHPDPGRVLLIQGNLSRQEVSRELHHHHVFFHQVVVYDTLVNSCYQKELNEYIRSDGIDIYTFTSPSAVCAFDELTLSTAEKQAWIKANRLCVCIGSTTGEAAEKSGFVRVLIPEESTVEGMIDVMKRQINKKG